MDIVIFILIMLGVSLAGLGLGLYLHRRRQHRKRDYTDPKRDHVYRRYNRERKVIREQEDRNQPFEL